MGEETGEFLEPFYLGDRPMSYKHLDKSITFIAPIMTEAYKLDISNVVRHFLGRHLGSISLSFMGITIYSIDSLETYIFFPQKVWIRKMTADVSRHKHEIHT